MKPALITLLLCLSLPLAGADKDKILLKDFKALLTLAENGDVRAQFFAGQCYQLGENTKQDFKEAVKWFRRAAERGYAPAQINLGWMYDDGTGVQEDDKEAVRWFRKAAEQGDDNAQVNLGHMYDNGKGVPGDDNEAMKWYRKAAHQGNICGQYSLGNLYAKRRKSDTPGFGFVLEGNAVAYAWYTIAASHENAKHPASRRFAAKAKKNKGIVAKKMTPAQIAKAEELIKEMVKKNPKLIKKP